MDVRKDILTQNLKNYDKLNLMSNTISKKGAPANAAIVLLANLKTHYLLSTENVVSPVSKVIRLINEFQSLKFY